MANIFSLYGSIFIDNQKANESIDTTTKKAEGAGGKVKGAFGKIAKGAAAMGTAVVGGASAVAAGAMKIVNKTAAATDEVDKMSQKMGMSREGYQEWNYILSQSGMKIDNLKMGMKTMSQYMDSATQATSPATEKFEKLGLSIEELGTGCYSVKELKDTYMDLVNKAMNGQGDERFAAQEALDSLGISF